VLAAEWASWISWSVPKLMEAGCPLRLERSTGGGSRVLARIALPSITPHTIRHLHTTFRIKKSARVVQ